LFQVLVVGGIPSILETLERKHREQTRELHPECKG